MSLTTVSLETESLRVVECDAETRWHDTFCDSKDVFVIWTIQMKSGVLCVVNFSGQSPLKAGDERAGDTKPAHSRPT